MPGKHRKKLGRPSKQDRLVADELAFNTPSWLRQSQAEVLAVLRALGPLTDRAILAFFSDGAGNPRRSPSGLRTRRRELLDSGLVVDSGDRATSPVSGRKEVVWAAA